MTTTYIFVMGSKSGSGKSTVCLGILAQLLVSGITPNQLAYIKPATQCIKKQAVTHFCEHTKITCSDISTLVFRKGFSKDFIDGLTKHSDVLLADILDSILSIGKNKKVVIIDGIGHPSVGSVVGVSNVDVALLLPCHVIFVGEPGIGAALDNTVLCISFMHYKGLANIGIVYNKIPLSAIDDIKKYVTKRLPELLPEVTLLGFISNDQNLGIHLRNNDSKEIAQWFSSYVNKKNLFSDWLGLKLEKQNHIVTH
ncbi:AAA family ATPase [Methylobacter psychrophilus]|uniref:AAA family ATPase n=1 Tax=Methylobacter psychrophilus TaxID=96941 RepID=UPI0021D4AB8E|nr:AAA family ATPase [Methylobacter psychrophilus]